MRKDFTIEGSHFTLQTSFTTGKEQVLFDDVVLSTAGGNRDQFFNKMRAHSFEHEGDTYSITVREDALVGGLKISAVVNGQEAPVDLVPKQFSLVAVFVVIPVLAVLWYVYPILMGQRGGFHVGGAIGGVVGVGVGVAIGIHRWIQHRQSSQAP